MNGREKLFIAGESDRGFFRVDSSKTAPRWYSDHPGVCREAYVYTFMIRTKAYRPVNDLLGVISSERPRFHTSGTYYHQRIEEKKKREREKKTFTYCCSSQTARVRRCCSGVVRIIHTRLVRTYNNDNSNNNMSRPPPIKTDCQVEPGHAVTDARTMIYSLSRVRRRCRQQPAQRYLLIFNSAAF